MAGYGLLCCPGFVRRSETVNDRPYGANRTDGVVGRNRHRLAGLALNYDSSGDNAAAMGALFARCARYRW